MMNKPPPFKGLNMRIPFYDRIKGRGVYKQSGVWVRHFRGVYLLGIV